MQEIMSSDRNLFTIFPVLLIHSFHCSTSALPFSFSYTFLSSLLAPYFCLSLLSFLLCFWHLFSLPPARCFVCFKELDGWEPDDDPMKEHKSHSAKCAFLKLKNPNNLTVKQFLELEKTRQINKVKLQAKQDLDEFKLKAGEARAEMQNIVEKWNKRVEQRRFLLHSLSPPLLSRRSGSWTLN